MFTFSDLSLFITIVLFVLAPRLCTSLASSHLPIPTPLRIMNP